MGFAAVEVHLPNAVAADPAAGSIVAERELVTLAFEQAGVRLAGLSAHMSFVDGRDDGTPAAVRRMIDLAARLRCPRVRVLDMAVLPGDSHAAAALRLADKLVPLADYAADAGVLLLIQNAITFRTAAAMWRVLEQVNHPALACAWDPLASLASGEDPMVAIPVLNSRIQQVLLRDATLSDAGTTRWRRSSRQVVSLRRLGDGELDLRRAVDRLRGIGFGGPVVVTYPPELPPDVGPAEDLLKHAAQTWTAWMPAPAKPVKAGGKAVA